MDQVFTFLASLIKNKGRTAFYFLLLLRGRLFCVDEEAAVDEVVGITGSPNKSFKSLCRNRMSRLRFLDSPFVFGALDDDDSCALGSLRVLASAKSLFLRLMAPRPPGLRQFVASLFLLLLLLLLLAVYNQLVFLELLVAVLEV